MVTDSEIRSHVYRWLAGDISLRGFQEWFVPSTWDVYESEDRKIASLVDEIELNLSEYSDNVLSRDELRQALMNAVQPVGSYISSSSAQSSGNSTISKKAYPDVPILPSEPEPRKTFLIASPKLCVLDLVA